ncbi:hypothetical protein DUI87_23508 [Hirundo rustica rustica]|uniref:Uncharacterized protein n=1 Tax=Hirundo rustica rustica TaxID=333673 RepID=A0A3M0JG51_HIRRU|nr:hypothetical protein DUI87_23508 [Hirundo rustica rustica]
MEFLLPSNGRVRFSQQRDENDGIQQQPSGIALIHSQAPLDLVVYRDFGNFGMILKAHLREPSDRMGISASIKDLILISKHADYSLKGVKATSFNIASLQQVQQNV